MHMESTQIRRDESWNRRCRSAHCRERVTDCPVPFTRMSHRWLASPQVYDRASYNPGSFRGSVSRLHSIRSSLLHAACSVAIRISRAFGLSCWYRAAPGHPDDGGVCSFGCLTAGDNVPISASARLRSAFRTCQKSAGIARKVCR